jgi:hypothetical protein
VRLSTPVVLEGLEGTQTRHQTREKNWLKPTDCYGTSNV